MQQINELSEMLNQHFNWHKAKMDCFVGILLSLLKSRSVNLTQLAVGFSSKATIESRYRRIQRFIHGHIEIDKFAIFIMLLFSFTENDYYLTIDRTNWKYGKKHINILMLAVVHKGAAIPVCWMLLDTKRGNSKAIHRIVLLKRFIKLFGKQHILGILGDREFIGRQWLKWLQSEGISFYVRIRKNARISNGCGTLVRAENLFRYLAKGEHIVFCKPRKMLGQNVYLSALRLQDGELLILVSDRFCHDPIAIYGKRWEIETLFGCLKTRGFNLEDTHLTRLSRIKRMLIIPAIAFCWAHRTGEWQHEQVKPIRVKTHERFAQSIFRVGLDLLADHLLNFYHIPKFNNLFQFIEIKCNFGET